MKLNEKHIENLRSLMKVKSLRRAQMPHTHSVSYLITHDLVEVCGDDWIAQATITDRGRKVLEELLEEDGEDANM